MSNSSSEQVRTRGGVPPLFAHIGAGHLVAPDTVPLEAGTPVAIEVRPYLTLSRREREAVEHAADGNTEAEIAALMGIEEGTVGRHLWSARRRLRARNTAHAVAIAIRHGLVM